MAIQEYRGNMTIIHRDCVKHKNADGLSRWSLENNVSNPAWDEETDVRELPMMGVDISDLAESFWEQVRQSYAQKKNIVTLLDILKWDNKNMSLIESLDEPWKRAYKEGRFELVDQILYH